MAQYKVPQDVEAEDKLLGPFTFRQFVYLLIAGGLIAVAVGLFQIFPFLAIVPILPAFLFLVLALPLKKDQPMETYLAAIVSYYLKPRTKTWTPGQKESTILITAPKIVQDTRKRNISEEEATHRLSFLADIVDTEGYAIKGAGQSSMREDLVAEANATQDMFDTYEATNLTATIAEDRQSQHQEAIEAMRDAIKRNENWGMGDTSRRATATATRQTVTQREAQARAAAAQNQVQSQAQPAVQMPAPVQNSVTNEPKPSIIELANNSDFSVATIAKEANRIKRKDEGEVFIALH